MNDKQKLSDFLLIKLQECKLKPHDGAIYGEAADYIAEQLVVEGYCKPCDVVSVAKDKEKQLEEIKQVVGTKCDKHGIAKHCPERIAQGLYTAGYRKQSDVVKEFAEGVKALLNKYEYRSHTDGVSFYQMNAESFCDELNELAAEFGAEVE